MLCERCKNNEATVHLSEVIKDMKSEIHLCDNCARDVGLNTKISNFSLSLPEMLTFLNVDEIPDNTDGKRCTVCGMDFLEYKREGKLGCPECYTVLAEFLEPVLSGFHGDKRHMGKSPVFNSDSAITEKKYKAAPVKTATAEDLQSELLCAVNEERYEDAAIIRDKLREINLSLK